MPVLPVNSNPVNASVQAAEQEKLPVKPEGSVTPADAQPLLFFDMPLLSSETSNRSSACGSAGVTRSMMIYQAHGKWYKPYGKLPEEGGDSGETEYEKWLIQYAYNGCTFAKKVFYPERNSWHRTFGIESRPSISLRIRKPDTLPLC